ncbi:13716_t:CDS:2, partial [Ambispora leptoticha]
ACIYELDLYAHPLWRLFDKIEYSINDLSSDSLFKAVIENDENLEEIMSDEELTNEESENSSSDEDSSGDSTVSSEELLKMKKRNN